MEDINKIREEGRKTTSERIYESLMDGDKSDELEKSSIQPQKHGSGKHIAMIDVNRGGKTFKRKQLVGFSDEDRFYKQGKTTKTTTTSKTGNRVKPEPNDKGSTGNIDEKRLMAVAKNAKNHEMQKKANQALKAKGKKVREAQWYDGIQAQYGLKTMPVGIPKSKVEFANRADVHSGWFMRWKDPKTGADKYSYTREYDNMRAMVKFDRVGRLPDTFLGDLSEKSEALMTEKDGKKQQEGAVLYIMAKTGLRVGDIRHKDKTGNEGLTTLSAKSISVKGDTITLDFIGKSTHRNIAVIRDKKLATYLNKQLEGKNPDDLAFPDTSRASVLSTYKNDFGHKDSTVKDVRTVVACAEAIDALYGNTPPPPLPEDNKKARKLINDRLKACFETVSAKLNNSPKMAESSYVNPVIINHWMDKIGGVSIMKAKTDGLELPSIKEIASSMKAKMPDHPDTYIDDAEDETDVMYAMPAWMTDLFEEFD